MCFVVNNTVLDSTKYTHFFVLYWTFWIYPGIWALSWNLVFIPEFEINPGIHPEIQNSSQNSRFILKFGFHPGIGDSS